MLSPEGQLVLQREGGHPGGKALGGADLAGGGGRAVHTRLSLLLVDHQP